MKWINWKTIGTSLVSLILIGLATAGWNGAKGWTNDKTGRIEKLETQVAAMPRADDIRQMQKALEQLTAQVSINNRIILTVTGRARIQQTDGESCCIRINTRSRAANFADFREAKITNLSHPDTPSTVVDIRGTFRNSDSNYIAVLSREAASLIEASAAGTIDIRIEPIEEK